MITYVWGLQPLSPIECIADLDGHANVVKAVNWRLTGSDGTHSGQTQGQQPIPYDPEGFTPYEALTEALVIQWVKAAMGSAAVAVAEAAVADQIAVQADPPVVTPPVPWAAAGED